MPEPGTAVSREPKSEEWEAAVRLDLVEQLDSPVEVYQPACRAVEERRGASRKGGGHQVRD